VTDPKDANQPKQTNFLNLPDSNEPMKDRVPSPDTSMLQAHRIRLSVGDKSISLDVEDPVTIGRIIDTDDDVDFDLTPYGAYHFGISRRHARFSVHQGFLYLEDLGSTNGTRINGFQLTPNQKYRVRESDEIEFARLRSSIKFTR